MKRRRVPELMDDPALDYESHAAALRGLARLNRVSRSVESLWAEIKMLYREERKNSLTLLDIATGGGDTAIALDLKARQEKLGLTVTAADISADALKYAAKNASSKGANIEFIVMDALADAIPRPFDIIITSLFTHHLDPADVVTLLKKMSKAKKLVLVSDLVRSELAYHLVWLATRALSSSHIVQYDGPVSVNASYTPSEFKEMAKQAGLEHSKIKPCPPCRQLLIWQPQSVRS